MLKIAQSAVLSAFMSSFGLALIGGSAFASDVVKYDKRIEAAATEIVAKKMGVIRGSVDEAIWVAEYGVDDVITGPLVVDAPMVAKHSQIASVRPAPEATKAINSDRPVRMISSFLHF